MEDTNKENIVEKKVQTVLVVDDSKTIQRIVANVVKQVLPDSNVLIAGDGREAFLLFKKTEQVDLILTDWNMPNVSGLEFAKLVRENNKTIPIIMITTEGGKNEVITALKAGVNNYIVKPFGAEVLKEKLANILKK